MGKIVSNLKPLYNYPCVPDSRLSGIATLKAGLVPDEITRIWDTARTERLGSMIEERMAKFMPGVEIEPIVLITVLTVCIRPGEVSLWLYTLNCIARETKEPVTMETLVKYFPDGTPSEETMRQAWDDQKTKGGYNAVDYASVYLEAT